MKLKGFDLNEIFDYENRTDDVSSEINEIKEELKPYVVYFKKNDTLGICFIEQKENIVKVLKNHNPNAKIRGQFKNLSSFYNDKDYDWDNIYLGELTLDGNEAWNEFAKLLESRENELLEHINEFEYTWYKFQKIAVRIVLTREIKKMRQALSEIIDQAEDEYCEIIGINEYKNKHM